MSGRSAYVRKEKKEDKKETKIAGRNFPQTVSVDPSDTSLSDFPMPAGHQLQYSPQSYEAATATSDRSIRSIEHPPTHGKIQITSNVNESLIEKSSFRSLLDKKSDGFRIGLTRAFGKKKNQQPQVAELASPRPETSATTHSHELEAAPVSHTQASRSYPQPQYGVLPPQRSRPPTTQLPAIPPTASGQLKIWTRNNPQGQAYGNIQPGKRDTTLWLEDGDVEVFLCSELQSRECGPSFRIASEYVKTSGCEHLLMELHKGVAFDHPPNSPSGAADSGYQRAPQSGFGRASAAIHGKWHPRRADALTYRLFLPAPEGTTWEQERYRATTRNLLCLMGDGDFDGLVGYDFLDTLELLQARIDAWKMPQHAADLVIKFLENSGLDNMSNSPHVAAALLVWCENESVRWEYGWKQAFIHSVGMFNEVIALNGRRELQGATKYPLSPIAKRFLEREHYAMELKLYTYENHLSDFGFQNMWPEDTPITMVAKIAFDRLQEFTTGYYQQVYTCWPPQQKNRSGNWLTRTLCQQLQKDFAAVYDYLVDREVTWDNIEDRNGKKSSLIRPGSKFEPDSKWFPFTDTIVEFDNEYKFPHIPHPYPLVPPENITSPKPNNSKHKSPREETNSPRAKMLASLGYSDANNAPLLGESMESNAFLEAFQDFEMNDSIGFEDPYNARRGRWVLIYGVLQVLAACVVDTPGMKHDKVDYLLNPGLKSIPPWRGAHQNHLEANHSLSHCWTVRRTWDPSPEPSPPMSSNRRLNTSLPPLSENGQYPPSYADSSLSDWHSDGGSSLRSPTLTSFSIRSGSAAGVRRPSRTSIQAREYSPPDKYYGGYGAGIEKIEEQRGPSLHDLSLPRSPRMEEDLYKLSAPSSREPSRNGRRENGRKRDESRQRSAKTSPPYQLPLGDFDAKDFKDYDDLVHVDPLKF